MKTFNGLLLLTDSSVHTIRQKENALAGFYLLCHDFKGVPVLGKVLWSLEWWVLLN